MNLVMLYSRVGSPRIFSRMGFYRADVEALRGAGARVVLGRTLGAVACRRYQAFLGYFYTWASLAAVVARLRGKRVVLTGGADEFSSPELLRGARGIWRRGFLWCGLLAAHRVLLPSHSDRENLLRHAGPFRRLVQPKLEVVPHPLTRMGTPDPSRPREWRAVTIAWQGTAANVERKGVPSAIAAIAQLRRDGQPMRLDVLGTTGPGTELVRATVEANGVADLVSIRGPVSEEEKWRSLESAEVYFQLSSYEGFGVAALEALSAGCVVVHTGQGGLRETMGEDGVLLPGPRVDPGALHGLGERITRKRRELTSVAAALRSRLEDRFSLAARRQELARALALSEGPASAR